MGFIKMWWYAPTYKLLHQYFAQLRMIQWAATFYIDGVQLNDFY